MEDGQTLGIPRHLANSAEVQDALEAALRAVGVTLKVLRTAKLPVAEQTRWISGAMGLIGVHGAGLTNAVLLPKGAALVELIPSAHHIPNDIEADEPLRSQCGFTMFWYLAAVSRLRYYGLLLHAVSWEDSITLPPGPLVKVVMEMVAAAGDADGASSPHLSVHEGAGEAVSKGALMDESELTSVTSEHAGHDEL
eukprot:4040550-Prymnesium_polylepis.1